MLKYVRPTDGDDVIDIVCACEESESLYETVNIDVPTFVFSITDMVTGKLEIVTGSLISVIE